MQLQADSSVVERPVYVREVGWFDSPPPTDPCCWTLVDSFWPLVIDYQKKDADPPSIFFVSSFQRLVASTYE